MDAHVYKSGSDWMVSLRVGEMQVDEAGPFDDENDAIEVARRSVYGDGQVILPANGTLFSDSEAEALEAA